MRPSHGQRGSTGILINVTILPISSTADERLLHAAKNDDEQILSEVFSGPEGSFDIDFKDG